MVAISEFTDQVNDNEDGCVLYRSLQDKEDALMFTHYMIFKTRQAEEYHRSTPWVKKFVDILYPLLEQTPVFKEKQVIAG